jgi:hypothetical protein
MPSRERRLGPALAGMAERIATKKVIESIRD